VKNTAYNLAGFVNLGLDLKGGISLVLEPDYGRAIRHEYERVARLAEEKLREAGFRILDVVAYEDRIEVEYLEEEELPRIRTALQQIVEDARLEQPAEGVILLRFSEAYLEQLVWVGRGFL